MKKSEKATRSILKKTVKHFNYLRRSNFQNENLNEKGSVRILNNKILAIIKKDGCTKEAEELAKRRNEIEKQNRRKRNNFEEISNIAYYNGLYY